MDVTYFAQIGRWMCSAGILSAGWLASAPAAETTASASDMAGVVFVDDAGESTPDGPDDFATVKPKQHGTPRQHRSAGPAERLPSMRRPAAQSAPVFQQPQRTSNRGELQLRPAGQPASGLARTGLFQSPRTQSAAIQQTGGTTPPEPPEEPAFHHMDTKDTSVLKASETGESRANRTDFAELDEASQLLLSANMLAQNANSEDDYTDIVKNCVTAIRLGTSGENKRYAAELISWSLNRRGKLYSDEGTYDLADADFQSAIDFDKNNWRALHNRGVSFAEARQLAEAFDDFNRVIELNPKFAKAYANRATLFLQAGDLQSAREDYEEACRLDRSLSSAMVGLGRVCHVLGEWDAAYEHFTAAMELEPEKPDIVCSRGDLLADMGRYREALADYAATIEIDPEYAHAYRNGAWLLATCPDERFRDPENSVLGARRALEFGYGDRHVALDTLAAALASAGQFEEALTTVEEAIEVAPADARREYISRAQLYEQGQPFRLPGDGDVAQVMYEASDQ